MLNYTSQDQLQNMFQAHFTNKWAAGQSTIKFRLSLLKKLEAALLADRVLIQEALHQDLRKVSLETDLTELYVVLTELRHCIKHLSRWMEDDHPRTPLTLLGTRGFVRKESKGVVLVISPSNFPLNLSLNPLIHALAAGNCVVLKPSERTPATAQYLENICSKIFAQELVSVVQGDSSISEILLKLPFNHIHFTGGTNIGKIVMHAAAENLASVTLELGGKSPAVVDQTANLKHAAERIAWARFFNSGQTCIAVDYVLVEAKVYDAFLKELKKSIIQLYGNAPYEDNPDYARLAHQDAFQKQKALLADALSKGAEIAVGGEMSAEQKFVAPTVLLNVNEGMRVLQEEIFGPLLPVVIVKNLDEAIEFIQKRPTPLSLYHYSTSKRAQKKLIAHTRAGTGGINESVIQFFHPGLPFGGMGTSGIGRSSGKTGFLSFCNHRSIIRKSAYKDVIGLALPPFTGIKKRIASILIKWF
jgi:aldehyde dehydrogenase (NAD+)